MGSRGVLLALALALTGCGYTSGYKLPVGVREIAIPIFENRTLPLRREIEFDLTREVRRELQIRTAATLVDRSRADAVIEGAILSFRQGVLAEGVGDSVQETGIVVRVKIRLVRVRDGKVLLERVLSEHSSFSNIAGETISQATSEVMRDLAQRIVAEIEPWPVES